MDIMDNRKLIVLLKEGETKIIFYVKNEELYDIMHEAHIKTGHGGRELNSRCQVDLVDMQTCKDGEFKFILNYQDHLTKFIQLRPLKSKTAEKVAHHLLNIFLVFGAPNILHSDNGREFVNKVISELCSMWDGVKIVHGKPRHSQTQRSIERANQDFQNILRAMMEDNDTTKWSEALPFVQFTKNTTYHQGIKQTPYEAMFGTKAQRGLLTSSLPREQRKTSNRRRVRTNTSVYKKENTIKNRALALNGLQTQASVMLRSSNQKFPSAQVGDTVRVRVPDIDRGRMDYQNILAVVMDVDNDFYKLGTKYGIISQLYTRNQFAVCKEKLISLNDVLSDKTMFLRQVSTAASKSGGQDYVRCNCTSDTVYSWYKNDKLLVERKAIIDTELMGLIMITIQSR
ncbi:KRAB-A domain-containing protein 2-like [Rhopalosiphum padi]|uniref:KRAB-A domain-containing protein 2-like n=1 Tax=Rhopalosiphum padi TaxID=40932 RepID=UPI00298DEDBE|nr:KRAB-A domain-containing protein 2-like [Rhopalosiphum padi]